MQRRDVETWTLLTPASSWVRCAATHRTHSNVSPSTPSEQVLGCYRPLKTSNQSSHSFTARGERLPILTSKRHGT
jgi:hypothetical protein